MKSQIQVGDRVEAGEGEDYDTGEVVRIDGDTAVVAWDSCVSTPIDLTSLRVVE